MLRVVIVLRFTDVHLELLICSHNELTQGQLRLPTCTRTYDDLVESTYYKIHDAMVAFLNFWNKWQYQVGHFW